MKSEQDKVYAFLVSNTSLTYEDIAKLTDHQIGSILEQFKTKQGSKHSAP